MRSRKIAGDFFAATKKLVREKGRLNNNGPATYWLPGHFFLL